MDIRKTFETDATAEREGVWRDLDDHGTRVLVARFNNPGMRKAFRRIARRYKTQISLDNLPPGKEDEIIAELMAEHVLLDWEGMQEYGEAIEYSQEKAYELLLELPDFRALIRELSEDVEAYRAAQMEAEAGN